MTLIHAMKQKNVKILELLVATMRIYRRNMWGSYKDIVKHFLPDITMGLRYLDDYSDIYNYTQHELAHASHYMRVGNTYWNKYN